MLSPGSDIKIYLCLGHTDMRKGVNGLSMLVESILPRSVLSSSALPNSVCNGSMYVFRGKSADKIKILWWDGQGFCLFYKCFDSGRFIWPKSDDAATLSITKAQLSMLMEGIDWRNPRWSKAPEYVA